MKKNTKNLIGKKVKIVDNRCGHGFAINEIATITTIYNGSYTCRNDAGLQYNLLTSDFKMIEETIEELTKTLSDLEESSEEIRSKIAFMATNGLTVFNENEFKAYLVLKTIKEDMSDIYKAKIIAQLIEN